MALRLRRAVCLSSSILHRLSTISAPPSLSSVAVTVTHPNPALYTTPFQLRHFRSSPISLSSARSSFRDNNNSFGEEIGPDTILFEGCDYNHWLITMDFPKDPPPTREEMIESYLQTLAKVVGSYEEAKKKMYACSTTTYQGFQCLVSEEESEKFKSLPGVVFVLPDSYIDPVNKEYGGDKYDNGVITPRPPPQQYGRQGGRYGDRNRDFNRNTRQMPNEQGNQGYNNQGPRYGDNRNFQQQQNPSVPIQQGYQRYDNQGPNRSFNQSYDNQGPRYGDNRNFVPQQNPSVPNLQGNRGYDNQGPAYVDNMNPGQLQTPAVQPKYGPGGGERINPPPMGHAPGMRDSVPPNQGVSYNQNQQGYYNPQGFRGPPDQRGYAGDNRNYAPPQGYQYQQQEQRSNVQDEQRSNGQMEQSGGNQGRY